MVDGDKEFGLFLYLVMIPFSVVALLHSVNPLGSLKALH